MIYINNKNKDMAKIDIFVKNGQHFQLDEADEIHRGGEGMIFVHPKNKNLVAKIYHQGITPITQDQFNYLSNLDKNLFIVPIELLYDGNKNVIGYVMEYLGQSFFPLSTIFSKNFCAKNGFTPQIKRRICDALIRAIEHSHKDNVVIGDFNQFNIMINKKGDVKLIDTDSYQTPNHPHSGIMLEDIRDYLKGGTVSEESDFFALSVMLFNTLTYANPFKGVHPDFRKLSDRMINRIPIFKNDPKLKTPKCYEPISDQNLQSQFERLYIDGERFLISLSGAGATVTKARPVVVKKTTEKDLKITKIMEGESIVNIGFRKNIGFIETSTTFYVYDTKNKGYLSLINSYNKGEVSRAFVGNDNIVFLKGNKLVQYKNNIFTDLVGVEFEEEPMISQVDNILMVLSGDEMTYVYLDEIYGRNIKCEKKHVFGKGFRYMGGYIQSVGGKKRIFYNPGKNIANVKFDVNIKGLSQSGNVGVVQYVEKNKIMSKLFRIDGMNVTMASDPIKRLSDFAYKSADGKHGFIFEPSDEEVNIYRTQDFAKIQTMECSLVTDMTSLYDCNSGIIAWEGNGIYLLNKK